MTNLITLIVIILFAYWVKEYLSARQRSATEKERERQNRFLDEITPLLHPVSASKKSLTDDSPDKNVFIRLATDFFADDGYKVSDFSGQESIDLIAIQGRDLLLIQCHSGKTTLSVSHMKNFVADCTLYTEKNPIFSTYLIQRAVVTQRPFNNPSLTLWLDAYPSSVRIIVMQEGKEVPLS